MKHSLLRASLLVLPALLGFQRIQAATTPLPSLSIGDAPLLENETYTALNLPVTLSQTSESPVSVKWATQNSTAVAGSDYDQTSGTIVFKPRQTKTQIRLIIRGDRIEERDEAFRVVLSAAQNARIADSTGVVSIADNDYAGSIGVTDASNKEGNTGTLPFDFKISLSKKPLHPLNVSYATADGSAGSKTGYRIVPDYTAVAGTLTFKPGQLAAYIKVSVLGDMTGEADEKFSFKVSGKGLAFSKPTGVGTIINDDSRVQPSKRGKIAFSGIWGSNPDIYIMNADGTNPTQLTTSTGSDFSPCLSSDGSKIVFGSYRDGNFEIYSMNADGTGERRLTNNEADDMYPIFSPDGQTVLFTSKRDGNPEIYLMDADGSNPTRLTNNKASDGSASFSPDGSKIIFISDYNGEPDIYTMNADGTGQRRLVHIPYAQFIPRFSPDGKKIVYSGRDASYDIHTQEIYVMNADGTGQMRLTYNGYEDGGACFSPDGSSIVFSATELMTSFLYVMNADGSNRTQLPYSRQWNPSWSVGSVPTARTNSRSLSSPTS